MNCVECVTYRPPGGGISGVFIYCWSQNWVTEVREVIKRLPGGRAIHSVRVSAQTEPWGPDSCTGNIYNYDPALLAQQEEQGRNCKSSRCANRVATAPFDLKPGQNDSDGLQEAF